MPPVALPGTDGRDHDLAAESAHRPVVLFGYPRTGIPGVEPPGGEQAWNAIPGARGCTPQCLAYAGATAELTRLDVTVYGLSRQDPAYQRAAVDRLGLPYPLLSDAGGQWTAHLRLPTFEVAGESLLRRHTLVLHHGVIRYVRYPVFPPDEDAAAVLTWLREPACDLGPGAAAG